MWLNARCLWLACSKKTWRHWNAGSPKFGQNLSFNWHRHRPSESSPSFEVPAIQPSIERAQTFRHPPIIDRDNRRAWPNSAIRVAAFFDQMPNVSNLKLDNKYKVVFSIILFVGTFGTGCRGDHTFFKLAVQYFWWALTGEYQVFRCVFIRATISTTTCQQSLLTRVKGADYIRLHKSEGGLEAEKLTINIMWLKITYYV